VTGPTRSGPVRPSRPVPRWRPTTHLQERLVDDSGVLQGQDPGDGARHQPDTSETGTQVAPRGRAVVM